MAFLNSSQIFIVGLLNNECLSTISFITILFDIANYKKINTLTVHANRNYGQSK